MENEQEWIGGRNPVLEALRSERDIQKSILRKLLKKV
ncbi:Uncharacterised protein [Listeria grayi]|uniref:Uncharacterized protein n=1 Tax=Listeria grayi TaxID=1641 RepID=A0A378MF37_LISGR|nr:Uncharacterised protein [Listeria grayi]